jgi:Leucine-rich repeat (LRR) protein
MSSVLVQDIPATQVLEYTRRRDQADQEDGLNQKDAEEVESLVSSDDDESLGVLLDEEEEEEMRLPAEEGIEGYKALVSLDVRDNSITSLRTEVGLMQSLSCIYMCRNEIKVLPDALAQLCNLKTLVATHNQIQALPPDFGSLKCSLRLLDLSNNLLVCTHETGQRHTDTEADGNAR